MDPTDTATRINAYLSAHPDVTGILGPRRAPCLEHHRGAASARCHRKIQDRQLRCIRRHPDGASKNELLFSFDSQQYLMGYLPIVMLTLNAKFGLMPISNIYTGPNPVTSQDREKIATLGKKGMR